MELARTKFTLDIYTSHFENTLPDIKRSYASSYNGERIDPFAIRATLDAIVFNVVDVHVLRLVYPSSALNIW